VTIGNLINNNTAGDSYTCYTEPVLVAPGQTYAVSIDPANYKNRNFWKIWIDFNNDGEAEDYVINTADSPAAFKSGFIQEPGVGRTKRIQFFPNPVIEKLNIKLTEFGVNDNYEIYNMIGQIMVKKQITIRETKIDCRDYSPGIYMVMIHNNGTVYKEKIVKK